MTREIVLDTETTGLDPYSGHRIIEIGCIELKNHIPTGEEYHVFINPERDVPADAFAVHGLSAAFLSDKPLIKDIIDDFLGFIGDDPLVIHNAKFDMKFINAELEWLSRPILSMTRAIDTLAMARKKFPGSPASLDALCRRFEIDNSNRQKHGALIDSELLAEVYLELLGGRQTNLIFDDAAKNKQINSGKILTQRPIRQPRIFSLTEEELNSHLELVKRLDDPIWKSA